MSERMRHLGSGLLGAVLLLVGSPAKADRCWQVYVQEAEFGPRELGTKTTCPDIPASEEQSCQIRDAGVLYGVSEGLIVTKIITPAYSAKLPFGITWGQRIEHVVRDMHKVNINTMTKPSLFVGVEDDAYWLSTSFCFKTKGGNDYALQIFFDQEAHLVKIEGRIQYP